MLLFIISLQEDTPPERIRKRKQGEDQIPQTDNPQQHQQQSLEGEVPDNISHHHISTVAQHLVLLATSHPTIPYILLHAVRTDDPNFPGNFRYTFDDNFRNDADYVMMSDDQPTQSSPVTSVSGIEWRATPDLERAVEGLYEAYDTYDCKWQAIDFAVFVDESGENWCFKCVFTYPPSKKRCVVVNPPRHPTAADVD